MFTENGPAADRRAGLPAPTDPCVSSTAHLGGSNAGVGPGGSRRRVRSGVKGERTMNSGLSVSITCPRKGCGETHVIPLDHSGYFQGPMPCASGDGRIYEIRIEGQEWRSLVEAQAAQKVH